jgi:hypothetical protein
MDLTNQIETYIYEADILSSMIQKANSVIDRLEGRPDLQNSYNEELKPVIEEYLNTIKALNFLFEEYFEWEKKIQSTRNLRYRRLHKLILKDLAKPVPPGLNP